MKQNKEPPPAGSLLEKVRARSGSPGTCTNLIMQQSQEASDPKRFLKVQFKKEMKKFGIKKDMKKLKSFKVALMSRSQEHIDTSLTLQ